MGETKKAAYRAARDALQDIAYHTQAQRQDKIAQWQTDAPRKYRNPDDSFGAFANNH